MTAPAFIHLRVHSDFSMVDGVAKIKPIVKAAQKLNMPALALTDQMNFCGLVRFYSTAHDAGIKPIVGVDCYVQHPLFGSECSRMLLLAANNEGYQNLSQLISKAYLRGHVDGKPQIEHDWLAEYAAGVIVLSATVSSFSSDCGFSKTFVKLSGDILILKTKKRTIPNKRTKSVPVLPI